MDFSTLDFVVFALYALIILSIGLFVSRQKKGETKSERYFWLNSDFIEGDFKYKKWRTNSCESILRFSDLGRIQTCNLLSRNQMRYSVAPRGLLRRQRYPILPCLQNYNARIVT